MSAQGLIPTNTMIMVMYSDTQIQQKPHHHFGKALEDLNIAAQSCDTMYQLKQTESIPEPKQSIDNSAWSHNTRHPDHLRGPPSLLTNGYR
jgi:hypothetical protein